MIFLSLRLKVKPRRCSGVPLFVNAMNVAMPNVRFLILYRFRGQLELAR